MYVSLHAIRRAQWRREDVNERFDRALGRLAAVLVEAAGRRPWLVLLLCAVFTAGSVFVAFMILEVDTDSDRLLSPKLRARQTNIALAEAFPDLQNNLVVMIEADAGTDARAAAEDIAEKLRGDPTRFPGVFLPGDAPFYEDFGLYYLDREELEDLAARIEEAGPLLATLADRPELPILIGALTHAVGSVDGLASLGADGERILDHLALAVERFNAGESAPIPWEDLLFEDVGPDPDSPQLLFVRPAGDLAQMEPVQRALDTIRAMPREIEPRPGLRVRVTGDRAVHTEEMSLIAKEVTLSAGASLLLVLLVLLYCLRSLRLVAATLLTLLVGLAWTAGLAGIAVGQLNAITSAFAVLYIALGVDFGIHFALGFLERCGLGEARLPALGTTGRNVGSSLLLCALTTATGFYSFIPTDYSGVADMGIICGTGVLFGFLATLTVYPALIALGLGEPRSSTASSRQRFEIDLPTFPARRPRVVCIAAAIVTIACSATLFRVRFDTNTQAVRDPRVESVQALEDLIADHERSVWTIDVLTKDLAEARALEPRLEALEGVHHVNTVDSFLPDDQEDRFATFERMRSDLTQPYELSDDESGEGFDRVTALEIAIEGYGVELDIDADLRGGLGDDAPLVVAAERLRGALLDLHARLGSEVDASDVEALEEDVFGELGSLIDDVLEALPKRTVTLDDLPGDLKRRYLAPDGRARVEVFSASDLGEPGALERFSDLIHAVRPDAGGPAAGTVALARAMTASLRQALATAVVVITLLLLVLWRSVKYTLVTLTPLLIGSVTTAAVSVFADIHFNFANIIVLPLILGIGVDSGIHLVHRHRMGLANGENLLATSTARAVLYSALTTIAGFGTLAFSNHLGIASLGQMLVVGVGLMLLANVIVLPAVLKLLDAR
jgi:hopanoid biosynthesis associated RND transporter like protein HpnN